MIAPMVNIYMKTCNICKEIFKNGRSYSNHVRWKHKLIEQKCEYCKQIFTCNIEQHKPSCAFNPLNIKHCKQCGKQLFDSRNNFCNQSCGAIYNNANRIIIKKKAICCDCGNEFEVLYEPKSYRCKRCSNKRSKLNRIYSCKCIICNKKFKHGGNYIKTCGNECYKKLLSIKSTANPNCGGETNYKKYRYNGIYMDSTWELEIAKWLDSKNVEWKRTRKIMFWWTDKTEKRRRYYPDFYLPKYNLYIDPKNKYLLEKDQYKLNRVIKEHKINLIYGDIKDIIKILEGAIA